MILVWVATMLLLASLSSSFAQSTTVDLAPVINSIVQAIGAAMMAIITGILIPLAWQWYGKKAKELQLEGLKIEEQYRSVIDKGAQAALGGALGRIKIPEGKLTVDVKNQVIAEAGNTLAKNFPEAFKALGVDNVVAKAKEVIEARLGLMDAQVAGNPVPNPSQPAPTPATTTQAVETSKK